MRRHRMKWGLAIGLSVGIAAGLLIGLGHWPNTPLHAVATDHVDTFAVATGPVDGDIEAIYFLDFLTGDLNAVVIGRGAAGVMVTGHFARNVMQDLMIDAAKQPKFLMVTGTADLTRGGRGGVVRPSRAVLYVAEVTTGRAIAYAVPWNASAYAQGMPQRQALVPVLPAFSFRAAAAGPKTKDREKAVEKD